MLRHFFNSAVIANWASSSKSSVIPNLKVESGGGGGGEGGVILKVEDH